MSENNRFLSRVLIDATNRCNLRCIMCGVPLDYRKKYDMPLDIYKKIAQQVFRYTKSVWLSCGYEAFMSKDFLDIIEYIKDVPFSVLITNGTLLNETNISKLIEAGLGRLFISFDGARKETFEEIRKGANFEKIISNIKLINNLKEEHSSLKPEVCFTTTLMKSNIEEFTQVIQLAYQLKISTICCKPVQILFPEMEKEDLRKIEDIAMHCFNQAQELTEKLGIKLEPTPDLLRLLKKDEEIPRFMFDSSGKANSVKKCGECLPILFISPDGKVKPCTMWKEAPIGDFMVQDFWEIWEADEFKKLRSETDSGNFREDCLKCPYLV
jgi:radical SAM protein with 4Fe4S-binding SPASM domain